MNPLSRRPPPAAVGALVAALGFGLALWHGWDWYQLQRWTAAEIEQSVDLNLALDLSRTQTAAPSAEETHAMRDRIRAELQAEIEKELEKPRGYVVAGVIIGLFGLGQMRIRTAIAGPRGS